VGTTTDIFQKCRFTNKFSFFNRQLIESQFFYSKNLQQLFKKLQLKQACPKKGNTYKSFVQRGTISNHI
jgi:hypothetical protein